MQESSACLCTTSSKSSSSSAANNRMMGVPQPRNYYINNNNNNHESPHLLSSSSSTSCEKLSTAAAAAGGGGFGGSMFCNTSNQVACMSDIYDVVGAASGSGTNSAGAVLASKSLSPSSITDSFSHFNSSASGEMAAAAAASVNVRLPFTAAQLQELERQTLIYKYMRASAPIPHELLLPITKSSSTSRVLPSCQPDMVPGSMELRLLSNNNSSDPEPWRCRRTDGKKWRCSRDVAPGQKYCERHSHKSRPRSRKPVELPAHRGHNSNIHQSVNNSTLNKSYPKYMASSIASSEQQQQPPPPPPRGLEWFTKGETMPVASNSNQEWLQSTSKYGHHHHREHLINSNNLSGDDLAFQAQRLQDQYCLLLSPKMVSHHAQQTQETRHFIDAWSIGHGGENMADEDRIGSTSNCFVSPNEKLPHSSLTLSMSGGSKTIERNRNAFMASLGTIGSERENAGTLRPHWMNHVSGMGSPPGGPLAEVLCLGSASSAKSDSNATSPHGCSTSTTTSS